MTLSQNKAWECSCLKISQGVVSLILKHTLFCFLKCNWNEISVVFIDMQRAFLIKTVLLKNSDRVYSQVLILVLQETSRIWLESCWSLNKKEEHIFLIYVEAISLDYLIQMKTAWWRFDLKQGHANIVLPCLYLLDPLWLEPEGVLFCGKFLISVKTSLPCLFSLHISLTLH